MKFSYQIPIQNLNDDQESGMIVEPGFSNFYTKTDGAYYKFESNSVKLVSTGSDADLNSVTLDYNDGNAQLKFKRDDGLVAGWQQINSAGQLVRSITSGGAHIVDQANGGWNYGTTDGNVISSITANGVQSIPMPDSEPNLADLYTVDDADNPVNSISFYPDFTNSLCKAVIKNRNGDVYDLQIAMTKRA